MKRRRILELAGLGLITPLGITSGLFAADGGSDDAIAAMQARWRTFLPTDADGVDPTPKIERPHEQWKLELPADSYRVLFEEDTERPYSSPLNDEKRAGVFVCRACALPLFTSEMKFDSGTGWPSFFTAIPNHLETKTDFKLIWPRTEYHCAKCGGHQGHVFDDGPAPTGQRWCNNGVALRFLARDAGKAG